MNKKSLYIKSTYNSNFLNTLKHNIINPVWEVPIFYKFLQATLAGGGHDVIKKYLLKEIPKNAASILDQGCGTGEYSLLFGDKYTGIDNSKEDIEHARNKYPGKYFVGSAADMKVLKSNSFDVVFAVGLHHHLTDNLARKAILESIRVTKKGGNVVIVDAMWPKYNLNLAGAFLRKMDRGGNVRQISETLALLPKGVKYKQGTLSSFPFDYITIVINK